MNNSWSSLVRAFVTLFLWIYAGILWFVWFAAGHLPENAVLIRIGTSFISDLIWIPFGYFVWAGISIIVLKWLTGGRPALSIGPGLVIPACFLVCFTGMAFRLLFAPLAIASVIVLIFFLYKRTMAFFLTRVIPYALIATAVVLYYGHQLVPSATDVPAEDTFSIMTFNILGNAASESRDDTIDIIRRENPDIVCCTEYNPQTDPEAFHKKLSRFYPYMATNRTKNTWRTGEIILSRYPVEFKHGPETTSSNEISAVLLFHNTEIRLVNLHLTRVGQHGVTDSLDSFYAKAVKVTEFEVVNDRKKMIQATKLLTDIAGETRPTIICGDFNDTPNGRVYRLFARRYTDAFALKGWGLGDTFGQATIRTEFSDSPLLRLCARDIIRIDHIFVSDDVEVISSHVVEDANGSDHKPVVAVVRVGGM